MIGLAPGACDAQDPGPDAARDPPVARRDPPSARREPRQGAQPQPREVAALAPDPDAAPIEAGCALVDPPAGFVDLGPALASAILAMGYAGPDNFTGAPLPGYEARGAWLEAEAAAALVRAATLLERDGLRVIIHDAYRPRRASQAMVGWCRAHGREDLLDGWIAPRSVHNQGRAVDISLADASGQPLDMGGAWDQFDPVSRVRGVSGPALERRLQLRRALLAAGFEPYEQEWWHFEYRGRDRAPSRDEPYACR